MDNTYYVNMIGEPEFLDLEPYNPLISKCQVKVLYLGANRNGSYIDKNTATKMANTLPGCPIVGCYNEDKEDFGTHADRITIEDGKIKFESLTKPYGFVAPDARVWFQEWEEDNTVRTYLMCDAYLWNGQYPEVNSALEGKSQSMELSEEYLDGEWAKIDGEKDSIFKNTDDVEFFIINDAVFSKLCILGDDVQPCFENARIQSQFSNGQFIYTLQEMAKQLKFALENGEEGGNMPEENTKIVTEESAVTPEVEEGQASTEFVTLLSAETQSQTVRSKAAEEVSAPEEVAEVKEAEQPEQFAETTEEVAEVDDVVAEVVAENDAEEFSVTESVPASEERDPSSNSNGESPFSAQIEAMQAELDELREFKRTIDREKKMEIVDRYHMLSDADKQPVIDKLDDYTNLEIEKELAYIYVQNNVDFNTVDGQPERAEVEPQEDALTTFSLDNIDNGEAVGDELLEALRSTANIL